MINRDIKYIVISDIHLGNRNNTTYEILSNIKLFFNNYKKRSDNLDLIFIAGDLFDTLLDLSNDDIYIVLDWMNIFLEYCLNNDIMLRVLEGTPSHDWEQSELFNNARRLLKSPLDFKYIKVLEVEIIEKYNLSILYIPDEWNSDTSITLNQAKEIIKDNNLSEVDIAIMHGQFTYQLPLAAIKAPRHNEAEYLSLVKHYIHIGHVHQFSTYERILAEGSFDRLMHSDEIPKGGIYAVIKPIGEDEYFFVENKHAKTFVTIKIKNMSIDDSLDYLEKKTKTLLAGSFVRIKANKDHPLLQNFSLLKKRFIDLNFSKFNEDEDDILKNNLVDNIGISMDTYHPIVIRPETIEGLLYPIINSKYDLSVDSFEVIKKQLKEVL